jgi:Excreted virulence factor EspC, type VII ESX diderm
MGVPDEFAVDVPLLRKIAHHVDDVARAVDKAYAPRLASLAVAAGQDAGWSAADATRAGAAAWEAFLSGLRTRLSGLSSALSSAADQYEAADSDAAQRHRLGGR